MAETVVMTSPYVVWMWQHYSLSALGCDTLDEAVRMAESIEDIGEGSTHCIEGPEGVVSADAIEAIVDRIELERKAESAATPKMTHGIKVSAPDGKAGAWWGSYASREDAEVALVPLRARFGERATIREYGKP